MKKLKIAFVCIYSHPSICGVWSRVYNLSKMLVENRNEVHVFSTNIIKGAKSYSSAYEIIDGIKIHRFFPKFSFGENVKFWNFENELEKYNPDVVIAEVYRHPHTSLALRIAKKLKKHCFLVTHAPFVEPELRSGLGNLIVNFYDYFYGRKNLEKFDKIITITKWEIPYLEKLGVNAKKTAYIPNGLPDVFFKLKRVKGKGILFLGRISPIKNLESLIEAIGKIIGRVPSIKISFVGPEEGKYKNKLLSLIKQKNLQNNIKFLPAVYELNQKIRIIDYHDIFVLPSFREAMPQSLIEAMARGKIVVASNNRGSGEIIQDKKNGFLFPISDSGRLAEILLFCLDKKNKRFLESVRKKAILKVAEFSWKKIFKKFYKLLEEE